ncbi:hypothetical protein RFI_18787, partial [Reticulomyxa filosa]
KKKKKKKKKKINICIYFAIAAISGSTLYSSVIMEHNWFLANVANSSWTGSLTASVSECSAAVMNGFGGAVWVDVKGDWDGMSSNYPWSICHNQFVGNKGLWVHQVYFSLFGKKAIPLVKQSYCKNNTESNDTYTFAATYSKGTSAIDINSTSLMGKKSDCGEGCLGSVLPGDVLLVGLSLKDAFEQTAISGIISCAQLYWQTSLSNSSSAPSSTVLQTDDFSFHQTVANLEFQLQNAPINAREHILFNDTHRTFTKDLYVITSLCKDGTTTSIVGETPATVCDLSSMKDVTFQCGSDCTSSQYLFTRWEPDCYPCPKQGARCGGGSNVTIEYGYYAAVNHSWMWTDGAIVNICTTTFDTYLCPVNLCCNQFAGCLYDGSDSINLCAKNRDPTVPFCGKCLDGYSEIIGSTECKVCNSTFWGLFFIPVVGGMFLLTYFLLKDPTNVTPLFTYMYKSFLYFYQILPVLTYQGYNDLVLHLTSAMNLEFFGIGSQFTGGQGFGTCLLQNMTNIQKLWMTLIFPLILFFELLVLRVVPELLICCCDDENDSVYEQNTNTPVHKLPNYPSGNHLLVPGTTHPATSATAAAAAAVAAKETMAPIPSPLPPPPPPPPPSTVSSSLQSSDSHWFTFRRSISTESQSTLVPTDHRHQHGNLLVPLYDPYGSFVQGHRRKLRSESALSFQHALTCSQKIRKHFHEALWNSVLITYIVVGESVIKMINCKQVDGTYYLWNAGDITCYHTWQLIFVALYIGIILFPVFMFVRLFMLGRKVKSREAASKLRYEKYAAFTMTYTPKRWWYESVMMGRRILLISIYSLPVNDLVLLRAIMAFCCGCILAFHAYARPFRRSVNNFFEAVLLACLFFVATLSTIDSGDTSTIRVIQTWLCLVPLLFIPYLLYKYCHIKVYVPARQRWQSVWSLLQEKKVRMASGNPENYVKMEDEDNDDDDNSKSSKKVTNLVVSDTPEMM